jgi:hypothetical protein
MFSNICVTTATGEINDRRREEMRVELGDQETIINFNKEEKEASIFTYEKTWQQHLEKKLGLKPIMDNGYGGREYIIDKKRIFMPRAKRNLSTKQKQVLINARKKALFLKNSSVPTENQRPNFSGR